jgi:hypothetical protein
MITADEDYDENFTSEYVFANTVAREIVQRWERSKPELLLEALRYLCDVVALRFLHDVVVAEKGTRVSSERTTP